MFIDCDANAIMNDNDLFANNIELILNLLNLNKN